MGLVDSHCHLDLLDLTPENNVDRVLARAKDQGVEHILNVCVSISDFPSVLLHAETYPSVSASLGLHPNNQDEEIDAETLIKLGKHPKVIAIGETGLDYFRTTGDLEWQRRRFRQHISAAKHLYKPLIVHTRMAADDTIKIMREEEANDVRGIMHCFTEEWEVAKKALDLGFYISFSGIITFKNATSIQEVAKRVPLDRILIETDAPYLAPIPHRGKSNEPGFVAHTAAFIADLRSIPYEVFAEQSTQNFFDLFKGVKRTHV